MGKTMQLEYVIHRNYTIRSWLHTIYVLLMRKCLTCMLQQLGLPRFQVNFYIWFFLAPVFSSKDMEFRPNCNYFRI
jgi:hypothetical protein